MEPGKASADKYHRAVQALLTPLFYPALDMPKREVPIHEGRKRIDITYVNQATKGFFWWLIHNHGTPASDIVVECKNYGKEIKNPEFDQLAGRFSPRRGKFGLLCYRGFSDKLDIIRRCRDAALDDRGYIIALDDNDLQTLVDSRKSGLDTQFEYLHERFRELI